MWMDLEGCLLSEISQIGKENYIFFFTFIWNLYIFTHTWNLKKKKNSKKQRYKEQTVARGEGGRMGEKGEGD